MAAGPNPLDYALTGDRWPSWQQLSARLRRLPLPLVALALFVMAWLAYHCLGNVPRPGSLHELFVMVFMAPAFLAVSIRALRWRAVLAAPLFVAAAGWLPEWFSRTTPGGLHFYWCLAKDAIPIVLLGVFAWLTSERRTATAFVWMLAGATLAAVSVRIVSDFYYFSDPIESDVRFWNDTRYDFSFVWLYRAGLWTLMVTSAISWSQRATGARPRVRVTLVSAVLATVGMYAVIFGPLIVPLARHSIRTAFPFGENSAARIIEFAGATHDVDCLYESLDRSGWRVGSSDDPRFHAVCVLDNGVLDRISHRLLTAPNGWLAETSAPLLAAQHRYETVPILLRYAFRDDEQTPHWMSNRKIIKALDDMGIPQVALVLLVAAEQEQARLSPAAPDRANPRIQERLHRLLGVDAGGTLTSWARVCWRTSQSAPSPLSPDLHAQANATLDAFFKFWTAFKKMKEAGVNVQYPDLDVATTDQFVRDVDAYTKRVDYLAAALGGDPSTQPGGGK